MKNYEEKEKKLDDALFRLSSIVPRVSTNNNDVSELNY